MLKRANEVDFEDVYKAFSEGFSDYILPIKITLDQFKAHFFGAEGNDLSHSFVYYDDGPVGLVLGGIKDYEGIKTIRCGTMCLSPQARGKGYARKLLLRHLEEGKENGCKQAFLECIESNTKALDFYKYMGYKVANTLKYYTLEQALNNEALGSEATLDEIIGLNYDYHINWQNDWDYLKLVNPDVFIQYSSYVVCKANRIFQLYVAKEDRHKGIGKGLIMKAYSELDKPLKISFPSYGNFENYIKYLGFTEDSIRQVEMYKLI